MMYSPSWSQGSEALALGLATPSTGSVPVWEVRFLTQAGGPAGRRGRTGSAENQRGLAHFIPSG